MHGLMAFPIEPGLQYGPAVPQPAWPRRSRISCSRAKVADHLEAARRFAGPEGGHDGSDRDGVSFPGPGPGR